MLIFVFLTTSLSNALLNSFKPTGRVFNFQTFKLPTFVFELSKLVETLTNLLMSSLPTSAFKAIKSFLAGKSMPVAWSNSFSVA